MDALAQTALLVALTSYSVGFATLARNVRNKLFLQFALACSIIGAWALFYFISTVWPENGWYGYHLSLNAWLAPVSVLFIQSMMRINRWFTSRLLLIGSLGLCIAMTVMVLFGLERHDFIRTVIYLTPVIIVIQILILFIFDRDLDPVVGIRNRRALYGATLVVLSTCLMDHIPFLGVGVPIFGNFALTVFIFFISQAITQQRLLNFRSLVSRFFVIVVTAVLLAAIFSLVRAWAHELKLFFLNSFIAAFFLLSLLEPIRTAVGYIVRGFVTRDSEELRKQIAVALHDLSLVVNPKESLNIFEKFVTHVLKPEGLAFYLHFSDPKLLRRERMIGESPRLMHAPAEIPKHHPIFDALANPGTRANRNSKVLLDQMIEDEIERMTGREAKHRYAVWRDALHALGGNIIFPFQKDGRILGIAVLDVPTPPEDHGANWSILREMEPLADRVAELIEKSSVFDREREVERLATLGEMAAGLAHEIRNPLGAIKGAAQYLDPSSDRPESRFLSVIVEEADRLNAVVTQFLDYAKPSATREYKEIDLNLLVQKLVTLLSPTAPEDVDLRFQSSRLKARIRCAPEQIHQVLLNLIQNAFKALRKWDVSRGDSARGQVEKRVLVSLEAFETDELRSMIRVTIEDNGPGIPRENLEKIFIPFFTTDPSGTGLGLPICQKIIQAHGGAIEVSSVPGVNTQFRIILPEAP